MKLSLFGLLLFVLLNSVGFASDPDSSEDLSFHSFDEELPGLAKFFPQTEYPDKIILNGFEVNPQNDGSLIIHGFVEGKWINKIYAKLIASYNPKNNKEILISGKTLPSLLSKDECQRISDFICMHLPAHIKNKFNETDFIYYSEPVPFEVISFMCPGGGVSKNLAPFFEEKAIISSEPSGHVFDLGCAFSIPFFAPFPSPKNITSPFKETNGGYEFTLGYSNISPFDDTNYHLYMSIKDVSTPPSPSGNANLVVRMLRKGIYIEDIQVANSGNYEWLSALKLMLNKHIDGNFTIETADEVPRSFKEKLRPGDIKHYSKPKSSCWKACELLRGFGGNMYRTTSIDLSKNMSVFIGTTLLTTMIVWQMGIL